MRVLLTLAVLFSVELIAWRGLAPASYLRVFDPVSQDDVQLMQECINFGELSPGEVRSAKIKLVNRKNRPVHLLPPQAACGCLEARLTTRQLPPGGAATLSFDFRAPDRPGEARKHVILRAAESADVFWQVPVTCRTVATMWSVPRELRITLEESSAGRGTGTLHFEEGLRVRRVLSSHPDRLTVHLATPATKTRGYAVRVRSHKAGHGTLKFIASDDKPPVTVPVRWQLAKKVACSPAHLSLKRPFGQDSSPFEITVLSDEDEVSQLSIFPSVPWVSLSNRHTVNKRVTRFMLAFDADRMPDQFEGPVVNVTGRQPSHNTYVTARVDR